MKIKPLMKGSIIVAGTIILSLIFKSINPLIIMISVFSLLQLTLETITHIKEIKKTKQNYTDEILKTKLHEHYYKMGLDIFSLIIWFVLVLFLCYFFPIF